MGVGTLGSPRDPMGVGPGLPMGGEPLGAQGILWEGTFGAPCGMFFFQVAFLEDPSETKIQNLSHEIRLEKFGGWGESASQHPPRNQEIVSVRSCVRARGVCHVISEGRSPPSGLYLLSLGPGGRIFYLLEICSLDAVNSKVKLERVQSEIGVNSKVTSKCVRK